MPFFDFSDVFAGMCLMVKTTERHGEAPLKYDHFSGYAGGLFSLHVGYGGFFSLAICISKRKDGKKRNKKIRLADDQMYFIK